MDNKDWLKEVGKIEVPKDEVFHAICKGMARAERPGRKRRLIGITAAIVVLSATLASGFVNPTMNQVMAKAPIIGDLYKKFDDDLGVRLAEKDLVSNLNETITKNGVTVTLNSAYFDGVNVSVVGEVYHKGSWPSNEADEIGFDMNFEDYRGDNDPWLNGMSDGFQQIQDGFEFQWQISYPYEEIKENMKLPITIHSINGIQGEWRFNIPIEQRDYDRIPVNHSETYEDRSWVIETKEIINAQETGALIYQTSSTKQMDRVEIYKAVDNQGNELFRYNNETVLSEEIGNQLNRILRVPMNKVGGNIESITFYPQVTIGEPEVGGEISKQNLLLKSTRSELAIKIDKVIEEGNKLILDYTLQGWPEKISNHDWEILVNNLAYSFTIIDKDYTDDEDFPFVEGHSLNRNTVKVIDKDQLQFQSEFSLTREQDIQNFHLEKTKVLFDFNSYLKRVELEPFTVKLDN